MAAVVVMRWSPTDPRFELARRLFHSGEALAELGLVEEADDVSDRAHALLRELVRDGWIGELQLGRDAARLPSIVTREALIQLLHANAGNAAAVAREWGVSEKRIQRLRERIARNEEVLT